MSLQDIIKTNNIIRVSLSDNLCHTLSKLKSSHDSAFVFNEENKFVGLINPYYSLIKSSYPGNAKVEHCIYHPPKIYDDFSLEKTAELLIESKVHYLPIFNRKEDFTGIISARRLLLYLRSFSCFKVKIKNYLNEKPKKNLSLILEDDTVQHAINMFKMTKHSKLIVVNNQGRLKGILTYFDLIFYLMAPRKTEKRGEREGKKIHFYHHLVKNFAKSYVLTLSMDDTLDKAINLILDKKIGSVVIIDGQRKPIGIITTRDILRCFIQSQKEKNSQIKNADFSKKSRQILGGFFSHMINPVISTLKRFKRDD